VIRVLPCSNSRVKRDDPVERDQYAHQEGYHHPIQVKWGGKGSHTLSVKHIRQTYPGIR